MAKVKTYQRDARRGSKLHDALLAAGVLVTRLEWMPDHVTIEVADAQDWAPVDTLVAAHDPTTPTADEQALLDEQTQARALRAQAQTALGWIATLHTDMATITNDTTAPTLARTTAAVKTMAADLDHLATTVEGMLRVVAALARQWQNDEPPPVT